MNDAPGFWRRLLGKTSSAKPQTDAPKPLSAEDRAANSAANSAAAKFKRYRREGELGRGSMGVVYLATDLKTSLQVALKVLALQREFSPEDLADVRRRFLREAAAAGHLQHADILRVLDAGEAGEDAWIVMEYVRGQDLSHFTRPGALLAPAAALRLGIRLARALDYAHRHGVVHRDIKPANVMFDPSSGALRVMDFGIARIADGSRTRTGLVLGTPSFMSPEQLAGLKVDGRSDLYSLGVMLYQLLTGQLPHQSNSMAKLMYSIANQEPPDVRHYRPELPETLAMVLALALEKRPELRYASGEQMAADLEAVLSALDVTMPIPKPLGTPPEPAANPFEQTVRLDAPEAMQNSPESQPDPKP